MPEEKIRNKLPKEPFTNIALSLSGGGFRATAFHLGMITYLSTGKYFDKSLLERIRILSTASAGTFTGVKYVTTIKNGGTIKDCYKSMYTFMSDCDLVSQSLQYLSDDKNWDKGRQRSLINAFASVYHKEFETETFGLLWKELPQIHLKEISFNATEFNFALPFRFQKSERSRTSLHHEFIGNNKIHIPIDVAKEIRFSDIIAASSCFPFGFEPINFPDDFVHDEAVKLKDKTLLPHSVYDGDKIDYPIGLMDGSIDDNQGVEAVVQAEERMKQYPDELKQFRSDDLKSVDLYIISDASPPKEKGYIRNTTDKIPFVGKWNFDSLRVFGILSALAGTAAIVDAFFVSHKTLVIALSIFGTLELLVALVLLIFSRGVTGLTRKLGVPDFVVKRLLHFDKLKFGTMYNLFVNRRKSAMKLVSDVFIKQMRWFSYERVYGDAQWRPRLIMNAVFELTEEEIVKRKKKYPYLSNELLEPGEKIISAASNSCSMATTLWFTTEELKGDKNKLDTIIACGQFTMCFNLLEYIEKFVKNKECRQDYDSYNEETKKGIDELYRSLLEDWKKFKINPYWMVEEWNK